MNYLTDTSSEGLDTLLLIDVPATLNYTTFIILLQTHRVERATDYSHISMHSILLTTNQVHAMVDKLRQVYTENEYPTVVRKCKI